MKTNNAFSIDLERLSQLLIPMSLRKNGILGIVAALMCAIAYVFDLFLDKRSSHIYTVTQSGQVCVLERMLNDRFKDDRGKQSFRIVDLEPAEFVYAYSSQVENWTSLTLTVYADSASRQSKVWSEERIIRENYPYKLIVPDAVIADTDKFNTVKSLIQTYRLPGRICLYQSYTDSITILQTTAIVMSENVSSN